MGKGVARSAQQWPSWLQRILDRPLAPLDAALAAAAVVAMGTAYCAIYCKIAFYFHPGHMPVRLSAAWAAGALLPWFAALETFKRLLIRNSFSSWQLVALVAAFLLAPAALAVIARQVLDRVLYGDVASLPMVIAAQLLPALATFTLMVFMVHRRGRTGQRLQARSIGVSETLLPPLNTIDWIEAAGNYVEVHVGARTSILRLTMREVEGLLDPTQFVRIHRSTIVSRSRIAATDRPRNPTLVRLDNGHQLKVGDAYRRNLKLTIG